LNRYIAKHHFILSNLLGLAAPNLLDKTTKINYTCRSKAARERCGKDE